MGIRTEFEARHEYRRQQNKILDQNRSNYNRKQNSIMDQNDRTIDNGRAKAHTAGKQFAQGINDSIQSAKTNTQRTKDYGKMSGGAIIGDMAKRTVGKAWNVGVDAVRQVAKDVYTLAKPIAKASTKAATVVAKGVNHAVGTAKKTAKAVTTKANQAVNYVKGVAGNISSAASVVGAIFGF